MKKVKKLYVLCLIALTFIVCAIIFGTLTTKNTVLASAEDIDRNNYISAFNVVYDIRADRTMTVTEDLTFHFYGKSGFVREIPVNAGEKVQNISVKEIDNDGAEQNVYYNVTSERDYDNNPFICVDIGSSALKYQNHTFRLTYDYIVPPSISEAKQNIIALTPLGSGFDFLVEDINIKTILPDGYLNDGETICYIDAYNIIEVKITESTEDGKNVLSAHVDYVPAGTGVRFDVHFEEGILSRPLDFTPYIFVLLAIALLLLLICVKFISFSKAHLTPVVNFEAPNNMNPLLMGKLIDTRINNEDITSMIFYFADKGYLKINLDNENDPTLIRIVQHLPDSCADYEKTMFEGLFARGDTVKPSQLANRFYKTVEKVTARVNAQTKGLFTSKSMIAAVLFAVLGGFMLGIAPFVLALTQISVKYFVLAPFLSVIPALIVFGASQTVKWYELKIDKKKKTVYSIGIAAVCLVLCFLYALFVPNWVMGFIPKFLLCAVCCVICALSVTLLNRSEEYIKQLNEIVGFKNFILLAEKDRIEKMLEDDPQLYYHVLPYAQVLGVSDKWEEKFKNITVQPPQWASSSALNNVFTFYAFNSLMRNTMTSMTRTMTSRPSSSGASGSHFGGSGGSFGGFSGGGHGGGGGHFR